MWEKLEQIERRYQELSEQMAKPEIGSDVQQVQKLAQEKAAIEDLVNGYREYKAASKTLQDTRAMLSSELDADMAILVKQEIAGLESRLEELQEKHEIIGKNMHVKSLIEHLGYARASFWTSKVFLGLGLGLGLNFNCELK